MSDLKPRPTAGDYWRVFENMRSIASEGHPAEDFNDELDRMWLEMTAEDRAIVRAGLRSTRAPNPPGV